MLATSERVDRLEDMMAEVAHAQMRTEMSLLALSKEMREFKDEMREFTEESERDRKRMNKAWGDLANKLGTTVEDVVAPNIPRIAREEFTMGDRMDLLVRARRMNRRGAQREREYDIVCAGEGKVLIVEVKSSPSKDQIPEFLARLEDLFDFYPEYDNWQKIGIFASWSLPTPMLEVLAKSGLYGLSMGDETMQIVARPC
ncbi:MAG: hypothetical protein WEB60_07460 [Terrimicrobiaceae bacterium]